VDELQRFGGLVPAFHKEVQEKRDEKQGGRFPASFHSQAQIGAFSLPMNSALEDNLKENSGRGWKGFGVFSRSPPPRGRGDFV